MFRNGYSPTTAPPASRSQFVRTRKRIFHRAHLCVTIFAFSLSVILPSTAAAQCSSCNGGQCQPRQYQSYTYPSRTSYSVPSGSYSQPLSGSTWQSAQRFHYPQSAALPQNFPTMPQTSGYSTHHLHNSSCANGSCGSRPTTSTPATTPLPINQRPSTPRSAPVGGLTATVGPAMQGYNPIALLESQTWTQGDPQFTVQHQGQQYWLNSAQQKQQFLEQPDRYVPVLDQQCVVGWKDQGQKVAGSIQHTALYQDRIYLFQTQQAKRTFLARPDFYAQLLTPVNDPAPIRPTDSVGLAPLLSDQ